MKSADPKYQVESLLAESSFTPDPAFREDLHDRLRTRLASVPAPVASGDRVNGAHRPRPAFLPRLWQRALAGAVVALAGLVSLVAFVPAVKAQVAETLLHFGVALPFSDGGLVISSFTPLAPAEAPSGINYFYSLNLDTGEKKYIELRYFNQEQFVVIYETPAAPGLTFPAGDAVKIGSLDGVLTRQNGGMVLLAAPGPQPWRSAGSGGGGGGGAGEAPQMMGYDAAVQVTWVQDGMWVELLTNLPEDEALRLAATLQPAPQLIEK